eukprot:UN29983
MTTIISKEIAQLPPYWEVKHDPSSGRTYYVNHKTKSSQWHYPIPEQAVSGESSHDPIPNTAGCGESGLGFDPEPNAPPPGAAAEGKSPYKKDLISMDKIVINPRCADKDGQEQEDYEMVCKNCVMLDSLKIEKNVDVW